MSVLPAGLAGGSLAYVYPIANSVRFRSSASAYMSRTPGVAGNQKTWTWSGWCKRAAFADTFLCSANYNAGSGFTGIRFFSDTLDFISFNGSSATQELRTNRVFRDPSAWYHIVLTYDSGNGTASDRIRMYVNGVRETSFLTASYPALNFTAGFNSNVLHSLASNWNPAGASAFDGYLAEVNFIDGQALDASSFGQTDANGVWTPKAYSGAYGTNGYYLKFNNATSVATLGNDSSGNSNTWGVSNVSLTAGSTYDWMVDTPTNNYPVLNALAPPSSTFRVIPQQGNLYAAPDPTNSFCYGDYFVPQSGKWYWEVEMSQNSTYGMATGLTSVYGTAGATWPANDYSFYNATGNKHSSAGFVAYGSVWWTSGVTYNIGVAIDMGTGQLTFYLNGVSQGVAYTLSTSTDWIPYSIHTSGTGSSLHAWNFGQRPFAYTPPTGFSALCTSNLPAPTIANGRTNFDVKTRTGTGSSVNITGYQFAPDFVWIKSRGRAVDHALYDRLRGTQARLESNTTDAEVTADAGLTAFNSDGYTLNTLDQVNGTTATNSFVDWAWKANGAGVSNTAGSITSTVSANTTAGFSIVTYTGTGANATVGHGLGVAPKMVIVKARNAINDWPMYHVALTSAAYTIYLNATNAQASQPTVWNSTAPTSSVFSIGTGSGVNVSSQTQVAYCFAEIAGYSKFGSYTGNGSADGTFVYCGFRPRWILVKRTSAVENWYLYDTARFPSNQIALGLFPNLANAESSIVGVLDILSNGFKFRSTSVENNGSGSTYIFAAFAENPFGGTGVSPANAC